jgi:hypothetical protein
LWTTWDAPSCWHRGMLPPPRVTTFRSEVAVEPDSHVALGGGSVPIEIAQFVGQRIIWTANMEDLAALFLAAYTGAAAQLPQGTPANPDDPFEGTFVGRNVVGPVTVEIRRTSEGYVVNRSKRHAGNVRRGTARCPDGISGSSSSRDGGQGNWRIVTRLASSILELRHAPFLLRGVPVVSFLHRSARSLSQGDRQSAQRGHRQTRADRANGVRHRMAAGRRADSAGDRPARTHRVPAVRLHWTLKDSESMKECWRGRAIAAWADAEHAEGPVKQMATA